MSRIQRSSFPWLAAVSLLLFFLSPVLPAGAKSLEVYDLDSLVHLSTDVVEAEVTGKPLDKVTVTAVHKGELRTGMRVSIAGIGLYTKPDTKTPGSINSVPPGEGDRLVLFLTRPAGEGESYYPLPGGMRLVSSGRCYGFSQRMNPGPYVAMLPEEGLKDESPTAEQFQEQIRVSLRNTREWAELLKAAPDQMDVERLLALLEARSGGLNDFQARDDFSERICSRFAETHDPVLLSRALPLAAGPGRTILMRGFGTPAGRDWLLAKVADANEPMPKRLLYSGALQDAGKVYRSTHTEITANSWREEGEPDEGNSGYLTRIAKTARELAKEEKLCRNLVECLDYFGQGIVQNKPEPLMVDLRGAFAELSELYRTSSFEELQFVIEKAAAWDAGSYEKLGSACGPLISILRPVDPAQHGTPVKGRLTFRYDFTSLLISRGTLVNPSVVLIHEASSQRHVVATGIQIEGNQMGGGSDSVQLPPDLPAGRYRIYLELDDKDGIKSKGHSFEAEL